MFSVHIQSAYPVLSRTLSAMVAGEDIDVRNRSLREQIDIELAGVSEDQPAMDEISQGMWDAGEHLHSRFVKVSTSAYHHLGSGDKVRNFMGQIWCITMKKCGPSETQEFLTSILGEQKFFLFEALDFAPQIFRHVNLPARFMATWIRDTRKAVGNDLYQRGLWLCIENYSRFQSLEALRLIENSIHGNADTEFVSALARMLNWIRSDVSNPEVSSHLKRVEDLLRSPGSFTRRNIYFESWAFTASSTGLDETHALNIRDELLSYGTEQLSNWAFLLSRRLDTDRASWNWIHRELELLSKQPLEVQTCALIIRAVLSGWSTAKESDVVVREQWASLFFTLPPLSKEYGGIWQLLEHAIVETLSSDFAAAQNFLLRLAVHSGKAWIARLEEEREHFSWLNSHLRDTGHADSIVTALCFSPERVARRLGVKMFKECGLLSLSPEAITEASAVQLELLIHQTTLQLSEPGSIARLHACIAVRVDEIGGEVAEVFYDEVLTNAMNTNGYRVAIESHANGHVKLVEKVKEAHRRLDATIAAVKSPALQMMVPGRSRAEALSMRRFGRHFQEGMSKYSTFLNLFPTVPLLYGKAWRMQDAQGNLTKTNDLQKSEVSMEMPRLDLIAPERMRLRRLVASTRITHLQNGTGDDE